MTEFKPTDQQNEVLQAPATSKLLVFAGAGAGKTETLVRRIERLICSSELQPNQILVLSFSRAAVRELRLRLRNLESEAAYVRARTFDSFATRLLTSCAKAPILEGASYEERILLATDFLIKDEEARRLVSSFKQIVIDEMQDLVGARQELVRALLRTCASAGFTLFADPAQSIYDYQVREPRRGPKARAMVEWLQKEFATLLQTISFEKDFRFETDEARTALWARRELLSAKPNYNEILTRLKGDLRGLRSFTLEQRSVVFRRLSEKLAILCRTNAQVLVISRELHRLGVHHAVQKEQTDRCVAPWLAVALRKAESMQMTKVEFVTRWQALDGSIRPEDPDLSWRVLRRGSKGAGLHLGELNDRLRAGDVPDELNQAANSNIIVSTIHRAKGLQFTHVLVADPEGFDQIESNDGVDEEAHVLYVALTRARRVLERLNDPRDCYLSKDEHGRFRGLSYRNPKFPTVRTIEFGGPDINAVDPAGAFGFTRIFYKRKNTSKTRSKRRTRSS